MPRLSMLGEALLKDIVFLGAALVTAADSLRAADVAKRSQSAGATALVDRLTEQTQLAPEQQPPALPGAGGAGGSRSVLY
jgi:hypothetical protein